MASDFYSALNTAKKVLALDFACEASDFDAEGVFIHQAREIPGRRRYPFRKKSLSLVTMGRGVVVSCSADRLRWAEVNLSQLTRKNIFAARTIARMERYVRRDGQNMAGPDLKYVCAPDTFQPHAGDRDIQLTPAEGDELLELYKDNRWPNALGYAHNPERPRVITAVARCNGDIVSVATASTDCDIMWQIGIDTLPEYRNRGIGKAAVSAVTEYVLQRGIVPYYSANISNIASRRLAAALGYRPAWVELYSREPN